jgi:hypothetical protein
MVTIERHDLSSSFILWNSPQPQTNRCATNTAAGKLLLRMLQHWQGTSAMEQHVRGCMSGGGSHTSIMQNFVSC